MSYHGSALDRHTGEVLVRKVRWVRAGSGKSGGLHAIYYNQLSHEEIWLLTLYAKNERATDSGT